MQIKRYFKTSRAAVVVLTKVYQWLRSSYARDSEHLTPNTERLTVGVSYQ